jgi:hypothetical protein
VPRTYFTKLVLLVCLHVIPAALIAGTQWVGVNSQSPSTSHISFSDNNNGTQQIVVDVPGFYFSESQLEGKTYKLPLLPDGHPMLLQGSPDLQKLSFTLQLPANGSFDLSVASSKYIEYTDIDILPSAGDAIRNGNFQHLTKGLDYSKDEFFPGQLVSSNEPFEVRNSRAQAFQVYPFQYNPATKVLRLYYQITFEAKNSVNENENTLTDDIRDTKPIEGLGVECINHPTSLLKAGQLPSDRGSMLIICPEDFRKAIQPLADWRIQTGITTEIITSEQFANSDAIYSFIKSYYANHSNFAYLLLVGDAQQVPPYMLPYGASDNYYSYLAGNDHYPDILVGRFSAETENDVEVQVTRTLKYEKDPVLDPNWFTTVTGIASTLTPGDDGESDFQHVRNLMKTLNSTTYNQYNEFFDGSQGEGDAAGNPATSDIVTKINEGSGVIFYTGHGSPNSWATGSITKSVVENLDNVGKYPLIWSAACEPGNFVDKYCVAEAWMRATNSNGQPTGALAALMSSGAQTSYPPMEAQDKVAEIMSNPTPALSTMGAISVKGMMSMNDVYGSAGYATTDTWILFGDPSLRVRTATPKQLVIEHKQYIGAGKMSFSFNSNSAGGYACLSSNGVILGTSSVSVGANTIYLDYPASGDAIIFTVTALNCLPHIASLDILNSPSSPEVSTPVNHSRLQPITTSFSWNSGDGANPDYYLFYLGTDYPPTNLVNGQKLTASQVTAPINLEYNSKYYWRIVSVNNYGRTESKVMDFNTVTVPDEDFEPVFKSKQQWSDNGMQSWLNDATEHFEGTHSIRSGQINNNEYSSLVYPCEVSNCDFVSFWSKTSSDVGDSLKFMVDGKPIGAWSGISGWNFHIYKIEAGMHQLEWRYSKNSIAFAGKDAAWLDNIHLPVHDQASAIVSENGSVCGSSEFETLAAAQNYFALTWQTDGDGTFDDVNLENAVYSPGLSDIEKGHTTLQIHLKGFEGCPEVDKQVSLDINANPIINLPSDTIVGSGSIVLDASNEGNVSYEWKPDGSTSSSVLIDSLSAVNGIKNASIKVTNGNGCTATKDIKIHFNNSAIEDSFSVYPNPSNGNFTLEPAKGTAIIDQMMLVDRNGKVVWQNNESSSIVGSKQLSIPGLTSGAYFLIAENSSNRSVNKVVIK